MTWASKFFLLSEIIFKLSPVVLLKIRQHDFLKIVLVQSELIFNLWMKCMNPEIDNTFSEEKEGSHDVDKTLRLQRVHGGGGCQQSGNPNYVIRKLLSN